MAFPRSTPFADGEVWNGAAVNDLEQRASSVLANVSTPAWEPYQDPGVGGRVVKVLVSKYDSSRIYVSGDMLGVGVSFDGGGTFEGGFGFQTWEMGSFTEHPTDPLTVWVGSMGGPYKSSDGGRTWTLKRSGMPAMSTSIYSAPVEKVLFDPADSTHLLAFGGSWRIWRFASGGGVSNYGKVYESHNAGETWTTKVDVSTSASLPSTNENIAWASAASDWSSIYVALQHYGILKSTDQGATWTQVNTGLPSSTGTQTNWPTTSVIFDPSDGTHQTLYCTLAASAVTVGGFWQPGGVYKTTNGGTSWSLAGTGQPQQTSNVSQSSATWIDSVHLTADGVLYFADQNTTHNNDFYKSTDSGATWTHITPSVTRFFPGPLNVHQFTDDPATAGTVWGGTNDGLVYTTDAGTTWRDGGDLITNAGAKRGRGYSGVLGVRATFNRWRKGFVILNGFDSANVMMTKDGGQSWTGPIWSGWDFYTGGYDTAFGGPTGNVIYSLLGQAGIFNGVAVSQDTGATWAFKAGSGVGLPTRGANTGGNAQNGLAIGSADGSVCFVAFAGTLYKTTNFGTSWSTVTGPSSPGNVTISRDFQTIVTVGAATNPRVSIDGGTTWGADNSPATLHLTRVIAAPDGTFWGVGYGDRFAGAGATAGVYHRPAGAAPQAWTKVYSGTFQSYAEDVAVDPYDANHILVATDQNPYNDASRAGGVLESKDGGVTWAQQNAGLRMTRVMSVAFDPWEHGRVVIGTDGAGYFTSKLYGSSTPTPKGLHSGVAGITDVPNLEPRLRKLQNELDTFQALTGVSLSGTPSGSNQAPVTTDSSHATWQTLPSGSYATWRKDIVPQLGFTVNQGTWTLLASASAVIGPIGSGGVQNDSIQWACDLSAGTWTLNVLHPKGSDQGIVTLFLDGTSLGTIDCYNASTLWNVADAFTGITVGSTGQHTLKATVATKNASSTAYKFFAQLFSWVRTA